MREIHARQRRSATALLSAALEYARRWHWQVVPGIGFDRVDGVPVCRCPRSECPVPGAHAADPPLLAATTDQRMIQWWWTRNPGAPIVLPTGRDFAVLEVSAAAGRIALARFQAMDAGLGPVMATPERFFFFVAPYEFEELAFLLNQFDCSPADVRCYGPGGYVMAPPTRLPEGLLRWRIHPSETSGPLPACAELVGELVTASQRAASTARLPRP